PDGSSEADSSEGDPSSDADSNGSSQGRRNRGRSSLTSYFPQLDFLLLEQGVDLADVFVGQILQLLLGPADVVVRYLAVERLDVSPCVSTDGPHCHSAVLGHVPHHLDQLEPSLFGKGWEGDPDHLAVAVGIEPQVGLADGALDIAQ